ncbi:hypothetical protein [Catenovulum sediminis]|uniref:Lipoprotein n=1 Tax=Catenovulum sediminis TaxID=1740262 RepID=A0ABV1RLD6_9ALTE|nr:hypothetical protein [Catenovulum sediminis]
MKTILNLTSATFCILALSACQSTPENPYADLQKELREAANELNQTTPLMVDSETRLDSSFAYQNRFVYKYTLVNYAVENLDVETFTDIMTEQVTNNTCTNRDMVYFVNNKVVVSYTYFDQTGKQVAAIDVDTAKCPKAN